MTGNGWINSKIWYTFNFILNFQVKCKWHYLVFCEQWAMSLLKFVQCYSKIHLDLFNSSASYIEPTLGTKEKINVVNRKPWKFTKSIVTKLRKNYVRYEYINEQCHSIDAFNPFIIQFVLRSELMKWICGDALQSKLNNVPRVPWYTMVYDLLQ